MNKIQWEALKLYINIAADIAAFRAQGGVDVKSLEELLVRAELAIVMSNDIKT